VADLHSFIDDRSGLLGSLGADRHVPPGQDAPPLTWRLARPPDPFVITTGFDVLGTRLVDPTPNLGTALTIVPEAPIAEILEFLTEIIEVLDGSEQRISLRKNPRQIFELTYRLEGKDRRRLENILYDKQDEELVLPVWTEPLALASGGEVEDTSIDLTSIDFADLRIGGLAILLRSDGISNIIDVTEIDALQVSFSTPLRNAFPAGTTVYPARRVNARELIQGSLAPVNDEELSIRFLVQDNDVGEGFADSSAFPTLEGKVLLDGPNAVGRRLSVTLQRRLIELDNETGKRSQVSPWPTSKRASAKGFVTTNREDLWAVRRLLHDLRGRQESFFLPTFFDELVPSGDLISGSTLLQVDNVGFAAFTTGRAPARNLIRVRKTDGSILTRFVSTVLEVDDSTEQITVDLPWPEDIPTEEVDRIDYVELVRSATDEIRITHLDPAGQARTTFPVLTVFDE